MFVFATSSPFVPDADGPVLNNDNGFVDRLLETLPPFPRCLFVASSPERHDLTCRFGYDVVYALAELGVTCGSYNVLDAQTADQAEYLIGNSDFVVLAGGHVPTQNDFFQKIGLRELLEGYVGTVMGISAGTMNSADIVYVQPEEPGESSPDFPRFAQGLGLIDVNVLPHYQKVKDDILDGLRLFEDVTYADSEDNYFFALPDGSYFYQDDRQLLLCGEGYCIHNGILEKLTENDDVLDMALLEI